MSEKQILSQAEWEKSDTLSADFWGVKIREFGERCARAQQQAKDQAATAAIAAQRAIRKVSWEQQAQNARRNIERLKANQADWLEEQRRLEKEKQGRMENEAAIKAQMEAYEAKLRAKSR